LSGSSLEWTARTEEVPLRELIAVPVDVGKSSAMVMACDFSGRVLLPAVEFALTRAGVEAMLARVLAAVPAGTQLVRVGVEAAGHYHRPLTMAGVWPEGWQIVELNPAHVSAQRRVKGQRGVKTDRVDLAAIADLLLAGRGSPVVACGEPLIELAAWVAHRRRRGEVRTATKNQLLSQLDRAFPGLCLALTDVLGAKVGRGWSPRTSPNLPGWPGWGRNGSAISLLAAACRFPVRWPGVWCRPHGRPCLPPRRPSPGRSGKLTLPFSVISMLRSPRLRSGSRRCCLLPNTTC
jgi:hypothetical protein